MPPAAALPPAPFDADVTRALVTMGWKPAETRDAMASTATQPATTFEERIRAALGHLARSRGSRCSEGPLEYGRAA